MNVEADQRQALLSELHRKLGIAAEVIGGTAESAAKDLCPVNTGNLRNSISHATVVDGAKTTIAIGTNVTYAPYVELGTGKYATGESHAKHIPWRYKDSSGKWHTTYGMQAKPFLRPAIEDNAASYVATAESILKGEETGGGEGS